MGVPRLPREDSGTTGSRRNNGSGEREWLGEESVSMMDGVMLHNDRREEFRPRGTRDPLGSGTKEWDFDGVFFWILE